MKLDFEFNHKSESIGESLGLSSEEADKLRKQVKEIFLSKVDSVTDSIEVLAEVANNQKEFIYMLFDFVKSIGQMEMKIDILNFLKNN